MDLLISFVVFLVAMVLAIVLDFSMIIALLIGLVGFSLVALKRGFKLKDVSTMAISGAKESLIVTAVMAVIGFVTATWRVSGTITVFVYYGMRIITPSLFLIIAFGLSCLLSYALGTSFGVAGTVGVIFMTLARSGGVDPVLAAGAIMSGVLFGDRGSPVSSSANLVAGVTGTKIFDNVKMMMRVCIIPLLITTLLYVFLSIKNPISHVDEELVRAFENEFTLSPWAFVPAIIMLILPLLKVNVLNSMGVSIASGILVAWLVEKKSLLEIAKICIMGYKAGGDGLGAILNGGGLISMIEIIFILVISSCYSGIFNGTKMLEQLQERLSSLCSKSSRYFVTVVISVLSSAVFCNQTIAVLITCDLMKKPYEDANCSMEELAIDMENSVILIASLIPWSIACSVPLAFFGVGYSAIAYAFYIYLVPISYFFIKKRWYKA